MGGDAAKEFYSQFLQEVRKGHPGGDEKVKDGKFGAYMQVNIQNDGPVTLELESLPTVQDKNKLSNSSTIPDEPSS